MKFEVDGVCLTGRSKWLTSSRKKVRFYQKTVVFWTLPLILEKPPFPYCFASKNHVQKTMVRKGAFNDNRLCTCQHSGSKSGIPGRCPGESRVRTDLPGKIYWEVPRT